jgi:hypothetical protein
VASTSSHAPNSRTPSSTRPGVAWVVAGAKLMRLLTPLPPSRINADRRSAGELAAGLVRGLREGAPQPQAGGAPPALVLRTKHIPGTLHTCCSRVPPPGGDLS